MPRKKAAIKRLRADKKRRLRNTSVLSELKTRTKKFESLSNSKNKEQTTHALRDLVRRLDKAASKGIIHANKAARKKSRLIKKTHTI